MGLYSLFSECTDIEYRKVGTSANYAVRTEGQILYIFFEASNGENDWKINLDFPAKAYKRMGKTVWFTHRGFLSEWKEIEPMIKDYIMDKRIRKIIITGYSHGAAIAVICHEYVWYNRTDLRDSIEGYGFGCPRVFWGPRTRALQVRWDNFKVIRNIDDIVTHLPPAYLGYSHVGTLISIGESGKYSPIDAHRPENILKELQPYDVKTPYRIYPVNNK